MTSPERLLDWSVVSTAWQMAAIELIQAARSDCEASSASCDSFAPALDLIDTVSKRTKNSRNPDPASTPGYASVPEAWEKAVEFLAIAVECDVEMISASAAVFSDILGRLQAASIKVLEQMALDDAMTGVRDFLKSGRALDYALTAPRDPVSENDIVAVLEHAVKAHDAPHATTPVAKPLVWVADTEDDCVESATTPFGTYTLQVFPKGVRVDFIFGSSGRRVFEVVGSTRDQGAAAAQADFAKRVQECMDTTPFAPASEPSPTAVQVDATPVRRRRPTR